MREFRIDFLNLVKYALLRLAGFTASKFFLSKIYK